MVSYIYISTFTKKCHRLFHPLSGDIQGPETFLAHSADNQTCNYDRVLKQYIYITHTYIYEKGKMGHNLCAMKGKVFFF